MSQLTDKEFRWDDPLADGNMDDRIAYALGHLISTWSGCERLFFAFHQCLYPEELEQLALATWFAHNQTNARLAMLRKTLVSAGVSRPIIERIKAHLAAFEPITVTRNFYCHANWMGNRSGLIMMEGVSLKADREATIVQKPVALETLMELVNANRDAWNLIHAQRDTYHDLIAERGAHHLERA